MPEKITDKAKIEAEATVQKNKSGGYIDRAGCSLVRQGERHLSEEQATGLLDHLRLRAALTMQCNLSCFFCSNEGGECSKGMEFMNLDQLIKLFELFIENTPIKSIDLSGGEPTLHPDFVNKEYRLIDWTKKFPDIRFSLHTNGIRLYPELIDRIKNNFSRIGISLHSANFETWKKICLGENFNDEIARKQFDSIMENIAYLAKAGIGHKVFLKSVIVKGVNDSPEELFSFLDLCERSGFHPKFLEFEPQSEEQERLVLKREDLFKRLISLGCETDWNPEEVADPDKYIPGVNFTYKSAPPGLHSIFGCGRSAVCASCYDFLCAFIKPRGAGEGLYFKPCSVLDTRFDLTYAIERNDFGMVFDIFRASREYLMLQPGLGVSNWGREK